MCKKDLAVNDCLKDVIDRMYFVHFRASKLGKDFYRFSKHKKEMRHEFVHDPENLLPRGGRTECHILLKNGTEYVGECECSKKDVFKYSIGRHVAFGRVMRKMAEDRVF